MPSRRVAYVVNHAAFFVSHRLPLAIGARESGFEVGLFTGQAGSPSMESSAELVLSAAHIPHQRVAFRSSSVNPLVELWGLVRLIALLRNYKPNIVHCVSPKGVLYGGVAARLCGTKGLVLAISGMGYAFTGTHNSSPLRALAKTVFLVLSRFVFGHPNLHVIVQNKDDYSALLSEGLVHANQLTIIRGSGVRLASFRHCSTQDKAPVVLLPARMLRDKGVEEFVEAARRLKPLAPDWKFVLAGAADYQNPSAIPISQIDRWQREGVVEWVGHVGDMTALFSKAAIVCLPSYREGMPKVLLEAAAAACAVITTDVTGCREAIIPGVTGDLVPVRDSSSLADAIEGLINDEQRRRDYGNAGQQLARREFSLDDVVKRTMNIYNSLI